jgi:DNA primase
VDIKALKQFLSENDEKIVYLLEELQCHHIKKHSGTDDDYITCGNPSGDNTHSVTIYLSPSLLTVNYTREISSNKETLDFIDLVMYYRQETLFESLKWITKTADIDYYKDFSNGELPLLKLLRELKEELARSKNKDEEEESPIHHKPEIILSYYFPYVNDLFLVDGVSYSTQREFSVGFDPLTNRITIPVFDEIGNLVGVKSRYFERDVPEGIQKFFFLESCPRNKVLYGYYLTQDYIKQENKCYVFEAEKSVMAAWSHGYKNSIATMGKKIGKVQIDKLSRLGVDVILVFDKDVELEELQEIANRFPHWVNVYALYDNENLMKEKMAPCDDMKIFEYMTKNCVIKLERTI